MIYLSYSYRKLHEEEINYSNNPQATIIETIEEYLLSTVHLIANPSTYLEYIKLCLIAIVVCNASKTLLMLSSMFLFM